MRKSKSDLRDKTARAISVQMKRLITGYRMLLETALEEEGITLAQLRMLNALTEQPEASAAELARTCFITPQSMQAVVTRAQRSGWIARSPSPANRRVLVTTLTEPGRLVLKRGTAIAEHITRDMWGEAKLGEMEVVQHVLSLAVDVLQPRLDTLQGKTVSRGAARGKTA